MFCRTEGCFLTPENWLLRLFQTLRFIWVVLIIVTLYFGLAYITPLLYPFLISLLIALIINRPVTFLCEKMKIPRWLSVILIMLALFVIIGGLITYVVATSVIEISQLIKLLPEYTTDMSHYIQDQYSRFQFFYKQLGAQYQQTIEPHVATSLNTISDKVRDFIIQILRGIESFFLSLPSFATVFVISLLGAFFISKDFYLWETRFRRLLPYGVNRRLDQILIDLRNALIGFVKAQLTIVSITALIIIVGLFILKVKYAITIGLLTGLADMLPYLGTGTVFVPWIVYTFLKGQYGLTIGLAILYAVVVIFRQIIEPKIVAESVGLDPLMTLVALFAGLNLFGFLGLIIGPVSLVVINALIKANVFRDVWAYIKGKPVL